MHRVAWTARLLPGNVDAYVKAHDEIWPEMAQLLTDSGVRNYSIHLHGLQLFGYYECEDPAATAAFQEGSDVLRRWGEAHGWMFEAPSEEHGPAQLREVFRLD